MVQREQLVCSVSQALAFIRQLHSRWRIHARWRAVRACGFVFIRATNPTPCTSLTESSIDSLWMTLHHIETRNGRVLLHCAVALLYCFCTYGSKDLFAPRLTLQKPNKGRETQIPLLSFTQGLGCCWSYGCGTRHHFPNEEVVFFNKRGLNNNSA